MYCTHCGHPNPDGANFSFYNFATPDADFDGIPDLRELVANMLRYLGP